MSMKKPWFVYILKCRDGTLYTGATNDVVQRLRAHNAGKGARYTKARRPVKLLHFEKCKNQSLALSKEWALKALKRKEKLRWIKTKSRLE